MPHVGSGGQGVNVQRSESTLPPDKRPHIGPTGNGSGTSAQRRATPQPPDKRPYAADRGGGQGTNAQRIDLEHSSTPHDYIPHVAPTGGGQGTSAQRSDSTLPNPRDQRPLAHSRRGGLGVAAQRKDLGYPPDKRPHVDRAAGYGRGTMPSRMHVPQAEKDQRPAIGKGGGTGIHASGLFGAMPIGEGDRLFAWFYDLAQRLARVVTLNRDWTSAVTPTLLQHTPSSPKPECAIFLDPPYRTTTGRAETLYHSDYIGASRRRRRRQLRMGA